MSSSLQRSYILTKRIYLHKVYNSYKTHSSEMGGNVSPENNFIGSALATEGIAAGHSRFRLMFQFKVLNWLDLIKGAIICMSTQM